MIAVYSTYWPTHDNNELTLYMRFESACQSETFTIRYESN